MPRLDDSFQCPHHFPAMLLLAQLFALVSWKRTHIFQGHRRVGLVELEKLLLRCGFEKLFFSRNIFPPRFNSSPLKRYRVPSQKEAESSSNHGFSEALSNFKGVMKYFSIFCWEMRGCLS